jgi:hypothetical protein
MVSTKKNLLFAYDLTPSILGLDTDRQVIGLISGSDDKTARIWRRCADDHVSFSLTPRVPSYQRCGQNSNEMGVF